MMPPDEPGAPAPPDPLYDLLPAVFRQQDIAQGYPLFALMAVFERVRGDLGAAVAALEDEWFIATCPLDLVPLLGALVGVDVARPVRPEHRALVADTLALRRRKGTAITLPRLVRDLTGWSALYQPGRPTPPAAWPLPGVAGPDGVLLPSAASHALPPPVPAGILRVWRLPTFAVAGATPVAADSDAGTTMAYRFNPLGLAQPLFTVPATPLGWAAAPPVTALPLPLTRDMLAADLARHRVAGSPLLYGPERGLVIRTQPAVGKPWVAVPADAVRASTGADALPAAPDYPALRGGAIFPTPAPSPVPAGSYRYKLGFGDATALLTVKVVRGATIRRLAAAVQAAIDAATVTPGTVVDEAAIRALRAGVAGMALAIVPTAGATAALTIATNPPGSPDPLLLGGAARLGMAAATTPLDGPLIAALTGAPAKTALAFATPDGQSWSVPLPLVPKATGAAGIAAAFAAALPTCFVQAAGQRIVIVPPVPTGPPPDPPSSTPLSWSLGLDAAVTIDPELGRFTWPSAWRVPAAFGVDYGMSLPMPIGGTGPRRAAPPAAAETMVDGGDSSWLGKQLGLWATSQVPDSALVLQGGATRSLASQTLAFVAARRLGIAGSGQSPPTVAIATPGWLRLDGPAATGAAARFALDDVVLGGGLLLGGGALDVALRDVTLHPPLQSSPPSLSPGHAPAISVVASPAAGSTRLQAERCLLGPIDLGTLAGALDLADSVLGALTGDASLAFTTEVLAAPADVAVGFTRATVLGRALVRGALQARDTLFASALRCGARVQLVDCYVVELIVGGPRPASSTSSPPTGTDAEPAPPPRSAADASAGATVTRCGTCGKPSEIRLHHCLVRRLTVDLSSDEGCLCIDPTPITTRDCLTCADPACAASCPLRETAQAWTPLAGAPVFMAPNVYPSPNFARLAPDNPPELLTGAGNRDEIGAYNLAVPTARMAQLEQGLRENLLFGIGLEVHFET